MSAGLDVESANQGLLGSYSGLLPSLNFSTASGKTKYPDQEIIIPDLVNLEIDTVSSGESSYMSAGLSINQTIYNGGKSLNTVKQAKVNLKIAKLRKRNTKIQVIQNVTSSYYGLLKAQQLLEVALKNLSLSEKQVNLVQKQFELGEVLIALNTSCPDKKILLREQRNMYNSLLKNVSVRINNIFEYNWHAKFLYSLYKQKITKNCYNSYVFQHVQELIRRILHILPKINEQSETNYLAVAFEALQSLLPLACNKKDKIEIQDSIIQLFYMLGKRYKNGLFYFNNNTARLDISGHVINGLII